MNRRHFVGALGAGLGFVFVPRLPRRRADDVFVERWSWAMGQPVHVMVFAGSEQEGLDACAAALAELRRGTPPPLPVFTACVLALLFPLAERFLVLVALILTVVPGNGSSS